MLVDFHSHTYKSDGNISPAELAASMAARGVRWYSVTDHDTLAAYAELPVLPQLVRGVEINTSFAGQDVHILGYKLPSQPSSLDAALARHQQARRERIEEMIARLCAAGLPLTWDDVVSQAPGAHALGRPHLANALVYRGYATSIQDALTRYLKSGGRGYVPSARVTPLDAIRMIREVDGIPVLAHPGRLSDVSILPTLVEAGIRGIEVFYPTHTAAQIIDFRHAAAAYNLVMTAGADFHDVAWTPWGVGMEVAEADITPFLEMLV